MANSRLERVGTIYTRIKGLLKAGAMRPVDRPMWYDIYEAFPPKNLAPIQSKEPLRQIFYAEDEIRARYHKEKVTSETINLADRQYQTKCQQFIRKYQELQAENPEKEPDELYSLTLENVKLQAINPETTKEHTIELGDSSLAASFKNAFNPNEKRRRGKVNIAEIVKDE
ncbi:small ribosomal subunit protein mS23 [Neocloeon triangulifer]|uniref:small ribosomal subunit protein mS23 n=1 Tax=Neocloeon triangulifer TaxID=2078957 RepID=UPI00286F0D26|nr:small ribosomal subunit protein mS23 [Neocloeon triangulifer]XP_059481726.1 small ribosomal subunit protein mS23 [Neocloeon triangulifer]